MSSTRSFFTSSFLIWRWRHKSGHILVSTRSCICNCRQEKALKWNPSAARGSLIFSWSLQICTWPCIAAEFFRECSFLQNILQYYLPIQTSIMHGVAEHVVHARSVANSLLKHEAEQPTSPPKAMLFLRASRQAPAGRRVAWRAGHPPLWGARAIQIPELGVPSSEPGNTYRHLLNKLEECHGLCWCVTRDAVRQWISGDLASSCVCVASFRGGVELFLWRLCHAHVVFWSLLWNRYVFSWCIVEKIPESSSLPTTWGLKIIMHLISKFTKYEVLSFFIYFNSFILDY
jgi:hypothetical protein